MTKLFLIFLLLSPFLVIAQNEDENQIMDLEFEAGIGYVKSGESNLFNNAYPFEPKGAFGFNLGLRTYFNYNFSLGLHLKGFVDQIKNYDTYSSMGFPNDIPVQLGNMNIGMNIRYTWGQERWQPYLYSGIGAILGSLTGSEETINEYFGIALNFGAGLGYMISQEIMVSISASRELGTARWTYPPSFDAYSNNFNPGNFALLCGVSYFFHHSKIH